MLEESEHIFMCLFAICIFTSEVSAYVFCLFTYFLIVLFAFSVEFWDFFI